MFLQKLELKGFKSFVDKTTLEFDSQNKITNAKGIAAIIGPNGSGKSNVADAVRWVLGEQSVKLLRVKKIEDVIFAGTDKKSRLGFCQVDLYLNNEDHSIPIDYSEVVITRRLYRDGESEYLINKNKVKLLEITMLLAKANFGQKNYSIIGQGMIDFILTTSPQERKEFFEEATGVKQYQIKRDQSLRKFEISKENLKQGALLLQEIEPRLKSLTRQIKKMEQKEIIEKELKDLQIQYYLRLWRELNGKWETENKKWETENKKYQLVKNKLETIQNNLDLLEKESSREEIFQKLQEEYNFVLEKRNSFLKEQVILNGKIDLEYKKTGQQNLIWLKNQQTDYVKQLTLIEENLLNLEKNIETINSQQSTINNEEKNVITEIKEIEKKIFEDKNKLESEISLNISEISDELKKIYQLQQNFIDQINKSSAKILALDKIQTAEEIEEIKKQAQIINQKMADFIKKLNLPVDEQKNKFQKEILDYQKKLTEFLDNKNNLINKINDLKINLAIEKEKKTLIKNTKNEIKENLKKIQFEIKENEAKPLNKEDALIIFEKENEKIKEEIEKINQEFKKIQEKINNFNQKEQEKKENLFLLQRNFQNKQKEFNQIFILINEIKIKLTKLETKEEDLAEEIKKELGENELENIQKNKINIEITEKKLSSDAESVIFRLKHQLALIGGIDPETAKEYQETKERFDFLSKQSEDLKKTIASLETIIIELDKVIEKQFKNGFEKINEKFEKYFKILFNGGETKLVLIKEKENIKNATQEESGLLDNGQSPAESAEQEKIIEEEIFPHLKEKIGGVEIHATPPGKHLKNINALSGGEKALTSIALICAIIANNPPPFIILDEVDAALDEANSQRFIKILDDLSHKTQFIIITHNRSSMEKAEILYGITINDEGVSKILSVKLKEIKTENN
ncbi:AAA family ATPase [Candidatus Kuenenbacteria bacterium]|nr:AAA family ATPase [Candidatus Kuenenbacteria bacterium]